MSEIKVNSIKGVGASAAAITVNNSDGTCTANITNNLSNRNLIINGAMQVAQRGTSSTSATSGYHVVDRFQSENPGADEAPTRQQVDVSSSSTPYSLGFRKAYKLTNGNQTGGAGADDIMNIRYSIEAQNVSNSGWNYKSASSFVTLQFWIKSSVSQNFNMYLRSRDGTNQSFAFDTGTLSADTWTKITKTIPGNSNIQIDSDNGEGFQINFGPFWGTNRTDNSVTNNVWQTINGSARMKDNTSTWYTTNDATFEITGVQLEVGSVATDFEHRSFGQELALCQRYYQRIVDSVTGGNYIGIGSNYTSTQAYLFIRFLQQMRAIPTIDQANISASFVLYDSANTSGVTFNTFTSLTGEAVQGTGLVVNVSCSAGKASIFQVVNGQGNYLAVSAEL